MTQQIPEQPFYFVVTSAAERDAKWHDGSLCYVTEDNKLYVLESGSWVEV